MSEVVILGGGISGLAASHFLRDKLPVVYEKKYSLGGHCRTHKFSGAYFDEGPHLIFTKHSEVFDLLSMHCEMQEINARIGNYWSGNYVDHPVIDNLCQLPSEMSNRVWKDFHKTHADLNSNNFDNFYHWCLHAYGKYYTEYFVRKYTKKYWQVELEEMSIDWMGPRLPKPSYETVQIGMVKAAKSRNHYISKFNYPKIGGFQKIFEGLQQNANIKLGYEVIGIDLDNNVVHFKNSESKSYKLLVNTLPITEFIQYCNAPEHIRNAAAALKCTSISLVNIVGKRKQPADYNWLYVYDQEMLSTRVTFIETLSEHNVPEGSVALQIEVYNMGHNSLSNDEIKCRVCSEALSNEWIDDITEVMVQNVEYANVVSTQDRRSNLDKILDWLSSKGLNREENDLDMVDDWANSPETTIGKIVNAGRFAQWKYFWTDDCVLRAKNIARRLDLGV